MNDLRSTIIPKSDQLNADDLIGGPLTIKVSKVSLLTEAEQPIAVHYEGDKGKPWKPCKSMRRVMVALWGPDGNAFVGRSLTLFRDEKVKWGGAEVGGIRISHMSNLDRDVTMALTETRSSRKPFTVRPLRQQEQRTVTNEPEVDLVEWAGALNRQLPEYDDVDTLRTDWSRHKVALHQRHPALFKDLNRAVADRATEIGKAKAPAPAAPAADEEIPF